MKRTFFILTLLFLSTSLFQMAHAGPQGQDKQPCDTSEDEIKMNWSLYNEDYKVESYDSALQWLRWILECAPGYPNGSDLNFRRAVTVYEGIAADSNDPEVKRAWLDSALVIFDTVASSMLDVGVETDSARWALEKGRFIQNHVDILADMQDQVDDLYLAVYDMDRSRLQPYYIEYILNALARNGEKEQAIVFMDRVESDYPDNTQMSAILEKYRGLLFTSPEERIEFLESKLKRDPSDSETLSELFELVRREGMRDRVYELAPRMMEIEPGAGIVRSIAKMYLEDGRTEEAVRLYLESLDRPGGQEGAREVYYNIGLAHQQDGQLSKARASFRKALQADPSYARAYIAIGDLYVAAVQACQDEFDKYDKAVYWLATDYFQKAASVASDDTVVTLARSRAGDYKAYFPNGEEKFFGTKGDPWETGESYRVDNGCYSWINESTTVR